MAENPANAAPEKSPNPGTTASAQPAETTVKKRGYTGRIILAFVLLGILGLGCFIALTDQGIDLLARTMEASKTWFASGSPEKEKAAAETIEGLGLMVVRESQNSFTPLKPSIREPSDQGPDEAQSDDDKSSDEPNSDESKPNDQSPDDKKPGDVAAAPPKDLRVTSIARKERHIDKKVFEVLPDLYRIGTVNMTDTDIVDADLKSVGKLSKLTSLLLGGTGITDQGLAELHNLGDLESLHLQNTPITDAGMAHLAALPRLTILDISGTKITDAGLKEIAKCQQLNWLLMSRTAITDEGLKSLEKLPRIGRLSIFDTKTTPAGIEKLVKAKADQQLKLSVDAGETPKGTGPGGPPNGAPAAKEPPPQDEKESKDAASADIS
jgi:hypothetical protein